MRRRHWHSIFRLFLVLTLLLPAGLSYGWTTPEVRAASPVLTVAEAIAAGNNGSIATVEGYVVGYYISNTSISFSPPFGGDTNFALADDPNERDKSKLLAIQVPANAPRSQFGLQSNPALLNAKVQVTGTLEAYFSTNGLKSTRDFQFASSPANPGQVANVTASPAPGQVKAGTEVTLTTATVQAAVYYSLDQITFQEYTSPIVINQDTTISAYAKKDGLTDSELIQLQYTVGELQPMTIQHARTQGVDSTVSVQGIVTYREDSGGLTNLYIQDDTAGIVVRAANVTANVGDRIEVTGPITVYNGLVQIEKDKTGYTGGQLAIIAPNQQIPAPIELTSEDFLPASDGGKGPGGRYEGQLISVRHVTITRSSSSTFYGTDSKGHEIIIYAKNAPTHLKVGTSYEQIMGVMTYHTSYGLELLPRSSSDIIANLLSVTASAPAGGIVKGTEVALSTPAPGGVIYYTLDGTEPTASSTLYTAPIAIQTDTTLKAIVVSVSETSAVYSFRYQVLEDLKGLRIHEIQGEGHQSIYAGHAVEDVEGIVTSIVNSSSFYIQELPGLEDQNDSTSEALMIYKSGHAVKKGDKVKVSGKVSEYASDASQLSITQLAATDITTEASGQPLPEAVVVGTGGRIIPSVIDTDQLNTFNPDTDAIDFFESLEGMLIELNGAQIVGPYSSEPGLPVTVDNGDKNPVRTPAGGIILRQDVAEPNESSLNPQKLFLNKKPSKAVKTGDYFTDSITGVLTYSNGNYKVQLDGNLPAISDGGLKPEVSTLVYDEDQLTIATFNVENFSKKDAARGQKIAGIIVNNLNNPDIIGLMEVQDNDGDTNSGTTDAKESYQALITSIAAHGGPTYAYTDVSPENNKDGGAPGANIRVGYLYNPDRVTLTDELPAGDSSTAVAVNERGQLSANPGRIDPLNEAFDASRKPLAAEFLFKGERVVVIGNHFNSKGGDLKPYGGIQPVTRISEVQRAKQAEVVRDFVKQLVSRDPNVNVVVLGDFNDFQFSRTLQLLQEEGLVNLVDQLEENERYSYIYDGNSQTLDHILVNEDLLEYAKIDVVHVNADFQEEHGRVSDHDPLLAQLDLGRKSKEQFQLRVLHTNDTHAHLDNVARRVTAVKEATAANSLLVDAGDVFSGTLYYNQFRGLADLYFMNVMGYDAMTLGNHEFDAGPEGLAAFVKEAEFPFVSSNIDFSKELLLNSLYKEEIGQPGAEATIYPAIIEEVNGERIGIFGLTTPDTISLASPGENITFEDIVSSSEATIAMLEAEGVNKIIALTHLGYSVDQKLAEAVTGIDVIVGGHSHTLLEEPVVYRQETEPTLIVQTGEYAVNLGQLDLVFNEDGVLQSWKQQMRVIDEKDTAGNYIYEADAEAAAKLLTYQAPLEELKRTVVGRTEVLLDGSRGNVRTKETNLGNLIADGMRAKVKSVIKDAEAKGYITITNGGGIRASIEAGDITLGSLLTVMPFGNNLTALKMSGKEIIAALENGVSGVESGEGRFSQVSGLRFYYDSTKPGEKINAVTGEVTQEGKRVVKVQIQNEDGTFSNIDPEAYYIVATNSFMANGGDFYRSMKAAKEDGRLFEMNLVDYEVFNEYLSQIGTVKAGVEGRIIDLKGGPLPGEGGTDPGTPPGGNPGTPGGGSNGGVAVGKENNGSGSGSGPVAPGDNSGSGDGGGAPQPSFKDIANHWAQAAITEGIRLGIVKGYKDDTFRPNAPVTRAEIAAMVSRAFKLSEGESSLSFADQSGIPAWAREDIARLVKAGFITGYEDNTFQPKRSLSRTEFIVILVRALGLEPKTDAKLSFADADQIPAWARGYIAAAYEAGLIQGRGNNQFAPKELITRAEVLSLLVAALSDKK